MLLLPGLVSVHNVHFYFQNVSTLNISWKKAKDLTKVGLCDGVKNGLKYVWVQHIISSSLSQGNVFASVCAYGFECVKTYLRIILLCVCNNVMDHLVSVFPHRVSLTRS